MSRLGKATMPPTRRLAVISRLAEATTRPTVRRLRRNTACMKWMAPRVLRVDMAKVNTAKVRKGRTRTNAKTTTNTSKPLHRLAVARVLVMDVGIPSGK